MSRLFKWIGRIFGIMFGLAVVGAIALYIYTEPILNKTYDIPVENIAFPTDAATIARGKHLIDTIAFCQECHGDDFAGAIQVDDPFAGRLVTSNLTAGKGGVGRVYSDTDFLRAIRHGVKPNGKPLIAMPANLFNHLSDADLAAIIAYLRTVPPVDKELATTELRPLGRLYVVIMPDEVVPSAAIKHTAPRPTAPPPGVTVEYGKYLSFACTVCHGDDFAGKPGEGGGINLTPGGELATWRESDFIRVMRTGVTPEGIQLDNAKMPWKRVGQLTDDELKAIWLFLAQVPPVKDTRPTPTRESK